MIINLINTQVGRYAAVFAAGALITYLMMPSVTKIKNEHLKREQEITSSYEKKLSDKETEFQQVKSKQQDEISSLKQEKSTMELNFKQKIDSLVSENNSLKKSTEKVTVITTYPDGRVEKKIVSKEVIEKESQKIVKVQQEAEQKLKETKDQMQKDFETRLTEVNSTHQVEKQKLLSDLSDTRQKLKEEVEKHSTITVNAKKFSLGLGKKTNLINFVTAEYDFYGPLYVGSIFDLKGTSYDAMGLSLGIRF